MSRMVCTKCGSTAITIEKQVTLNGQAWLIYSDGYRFWMRPADDNRLIDREPISVMEFKHNDGPADALARLMFDSLPDQEKGS